MKGCFYFFKVKHKIQEKNKKEKKKQKKSYGPNNVNLEHVPYLDGRKAKKNLMLLWNPMLDHYKTSHVSLRRTFHLLTRVRHKQAILYIYIYIYTSFDTRAMPRVIFFA
jgi:protein-tyrosine phosphatase